MQTKLNHTFAVVLASALIGNAVIAENHGFPSPSVPGPYRATVQYVQPVTPVTQPTPVTPNNPVNTPFFNQPPANALPYWMQPPVPQANQNRNATPNQFVGSAERQSPTQNPGNVQSQGQRLTSQNMVPGFFPGYAPAPSAFGNPYGQNRAAPNYQVAPYPTAPNTGQAWGYPQSAQGVRPWAWAPYPNQNTGQFYGPTNNVPYGYYGR